MSAATLHIGDTLAVLPTLPAASVDLVVTSPPFLALRSYLPADHPAKPLEHGSEATPAAFLATLLDVTAQLDRVLAPHGSLAIELGDTFAGSGGAGGDYMPDGQRAGQQPFDGAKRRSLGGKATREAGYDGNVRRKQTVQKPGGGRLACGNGWPLDKSLCLIPSLYAASLAYGRNILALPGSPEWREFAPWRVRNLVAWVRPNPPVGALGDKFRPATSYITIATRARDRWWDDIPTRKDNGNLGATRRRNNCDTTGTRVGVHEQSSDLKVSNPAGAPLLDWWEITPTGFTSNNGAHYATFPPDIVVPLVEAMCPRRVCTHCGTPSRRTFNENPAYEGRAGGPTNRNAEQGAGLAGFPHKAYAPPKWTPASWSTCRCPGADGIRDDGYHTGPAWRPGHVLDPYAGTCTTLAVATGHGRDATGIDLNPANAALAEERCGMFLTVVDGPSEEVA